MKKWLAMGFIAVGVSGCYTPAERGALIGGVAGSAIGAAASRTVGGALLGGALGAAGGAILGAAAAPPPPLCHRYRYRGVWYEECE